MKRNTLASLKAEDRRELVELGDLVSMRAAARYLGLDMPVFFTKEAYVRTTWPPAPSSRGTSPLIPMPADIDGALVLVVRIDPGMCANDLVVGRAVQGLDGVITVRLLEEADEES